MSYESAPATKLLATRCACCGRDLVDSKSVECGVGPQCRKKHGYGEAQRPADWDKAATALGAACPPEALAACNAQNAHKAANVLVYHIAASQSGGYVSNYIGALAALGYTRLARRMVQRLNGIIVDAAEGRLVVRAPYSENLNIRGLQGAAYSRSRGVRFTAPVESKRAVWRALCCGYPVGTLVWGERGVRVIRKIRLSA